MHCAQAARTCHVVTLFSRIANQTWWIAVSVSYFFVNICKQSLLFDMMSMLYSLSVSAGFLFFFSISAPVVKSYYIQIITIRLAKCNFKKSISNYYINVFQTIFLRQKKTRTLYLPNNLSNANSCKIYKGQGKPIVQKVNIRIKRQN